MPINVGVEDAIFLTHQDIKLVVDTSRTDPNAERQDDLNTVAYVYML